MATGLIQIDKVIVDPNRYFLRERIELEDLKQSVADLGMVQPIGIDGENYLLYGFRRLLVAKALGMTDVPATRHDILNKLEGLRIIRDENKRRRDFVPSEAVNLANMIIAEEEREAEAEKRKHRGHPDAPKPVEEPGRVLDRIAAEVGMSRVTLQKAEKVVQAAAEDPKLQYLVDEMDRTGLVNGAYNKLQTANAENGEEKKPPPARKKKKNVPVDRIGYPLPPKCIEAFTHGKTFEGVARSINEIEKAVKALMGKRGTRLMGDTLQPGLKKLREHIQRNVPTHVCPYCKGEREGCTGCANEGWVTLEIFESAPRDYREAMEKIARED